MGERCNVISKEVADSHRETVLELLEDRNGSRFTEDINETGYIFPDGTLPKMGRDGLRADDHALVMYLYDDLSYATHQAPGRIAVTRFINEGNIRCLPESGCIEMSLDCPPTPEQYYAMESFLYIQKYAVVEISDSSGQSVSSDAYKEVNLARILGDIRRFYREIGK